VTELAIRLVFSLAIVVGIVLLLAKVAGRRFTGRSGAAIQVVHRQQLTRGSAISVVTVGTRVLVLGTTDHQVSLLTELEPDELELAQALAGPLDTSELAPRTDHQESPAPAATSRSAVRPGRQPLAGSVLSPQTWRDALGALSGRRPR